MQMLYLLHILSVCDAVNIASAVAYHDPLMNALGMLESHQLLMKKLSETDVPLLVCISKNGTKSHAEKEEKNATVVVTE